MSIPDIISAIGSPICGLLVDKYGKRASLLPISALLVFITHFLMCFTTITPYFTMSILGVAYSVFPSALWPCVPYLVGRHQIATVKKSLGGWYLIFANKIHLPFTFPTRRTV